MAYTLSLPRSHSVDRLTNLCRDEAKASLAYVYCRYIDECTAGDVLRTFLRQLGESHSQVYSLVEKLYMASRRIQIQLQDPDAIQALKQAVELFDRTFFVLDGLDELSHQQIGSVLRYLKALPVHLLVFSRRLDTFKVLLPSVKTLAIEARDGDIEAFVRDRIDGSHHLHALLRHDSAGIQNVVKKIQSKSGGM